MGGGVKAAAGTSNRIFGPRPPTRERAEAAVVGALGGRRDDAPRDLALEHQRQAVEERRPGLGLQPAGQELRRDVIGKIGADPQRRAAGLRDQRFGSDFKRVAGDDLEPAGPAGADFGQRGQGPRVALDRDHLFRALRQQRAGERARSGADFDHHDAVERTCGAGDLARQIEIEQEVLAERLAGAESVRRDDVAQRRQPVCGDAHRVSRSASLSAAIRLDGLARPRPAMSNAVP